MSVTEAAAVLKITPEMVRRYIALGRLPAQHVGKRVWVLQRTDVEVFAADPPRRGWPKGKPRRQPAVAMPDRQGADRDAGNSNAGEHLALPDAERLAEEQQQ